MTVPDNIRKIMIESYVNGHSKKEISSMLGVKYTTTCSIIKVYESEGRFKQKLKGGARKRSMEQFHIEAIKNWIDEDCGITLRVIKERLQKEYQLCVCEKTVDRYIDSFSYSLKSTTLIPARRNDTRSLEDRFAYANDFLNLLSTINESNIFFVDEVGFNLSMRTKKGRSAIGSPAVHNVSGLRSRNISVCCAMNKEGIFKYTPQTTAFKSITFAQFITELLEKFNSLNINHAVIILDNVPFHKHGDVREIFSNNQRYRLMFLPPYSPFLNPIENMFAKWKQVLRQGRPTNEKELLELIGNASQRISSSDCEGYYRNIFTFIPRCMNKLPIIDGN